MMGIRMPETCWAVFKRRTINLRNCCIWLVDSFECMIMQGLANPKFLLLLLLLLLLLRHYYCHNHLYDRRFVFFSVLSDQVMFYLRYLSDRLTYERLLDDNYKITPDLIWSSLYRRLKLLPADNSRLASRTVVCVCQHLVISSPAVHCIQFPHPKLNHVFTIFTLLFVVLLSFRGIDLHASPILLYEPLVLCSEFALCANSLYSYSSPVTWPFILCSL